MVDSNSHRERAPRVSLTDAGWTIPESDAKGVHRRTIVQGAAWTVPVVATAFGAPLAAASNLTPTLEFTQGSYTGTGCSTITGVKVKQTIDGTVPDPGQTVTVTLSNGYTFTGGSTTFSGPTLADGTVALPDIIVPPNGGSSVFNASSSPLTATAPVSAPAVAGGQVYSRSGAPWGTGTRPTGVTSVYITGSDVWALTSSGELSYSGNGAWSTPITGVTAAAASDAGMVYVKGGQVYSRSGALWGTGTRPTGVTSVYITGSDVWALTASGELSYSGNGAWTTPITGVAAAAASDAGMVYVKGGQVYSRNNVLWGTGTLPSGVTSVYVTGSDVWALTSSGELSYSANGAWSTPITGVTAAAASDTGMVYVKGGQVYSRNNVLWGTGTLPSGVTSVYVTGSDVWALTSSGELSYSANGAWSTPITGVTAAAASDTGMVYVKSPSCT